MHGDTAGSWLLHHPCRAASCRCEDRRVLFARLQVVQLYFEDSGSKLDKLAAKLSGNGGGANAGDGGIDYNDVDQLVHQFKGSSASFGAQSIAAACVRLREACLAHDPGTCLALLQHIQQQFQVSFLVGC